MAPAIVRIIESKSNFDQFLVENANLIAVIHFWAPWNEPCRQLNENFALLAADCDDSKMAFATVEAENVPGISISMKIVAVPAILFIQNKEAFDRIDGFHPADLTRKVRQYSSGVFLPPISAAPFVPETKQELDKRLEQLINKTQCVLFMKGSPDTPKCGFSRQVVQLLDNVGADYTTFDILLDDTVRQGLKDYSNWPTYPQLYLDGQLIGGVDIIREELNDGDLGGRLPRKAGN